MLTTDFADYHGFFILTGIAVLGFINHGFHGFRGFLELGLKEIAVLGSV